MLLLSFILLYLLDCMSDTCGPLYSVLPQPHNLVVFSRTFIFCFKNVSSTRGHREKLESGKQVYIDGMLPA